jgi:hypothetical protein
LGIPIETAISDHLQRHKDSNTEKYHINSVSVTEKRLWVLEHNWDRPSFALGMDLAASRAGRVEQVEVVENLGTCCHDVLPAFGALWVLDSGGSALVCVQSDGVVRYPVGCGGLKAFPRGLAKVGDRLVLTYGFWSAEREARTKSASMLQVFDPVTRSMGQPIELGHHGNTCAVVVV